MFERIAVIAAMEREMAFLRAAIDPSSSPAEKHVIGAIGSKTVVLLRSGVGPSKTEKRLSEASHILDCGCVISIGCAGALSPGIEAGNVVISQKIIDGAGAGQEYLPSGELLKEAVRCCKRLQIPFHVGPTVSASSVAATPVEKQELANRFGAVAVDMESAKVAAWSHGLGIPMLMIRTISDSLADRIPPEASQIVDPNGTIHLSRVPLLLARRPSLIVELLNLKKKFDLSFKNLEKIVMALILAV